ncbi:MAG: bifunctional riboflavin kinase/FAD synthetase [Peptococcaceae bacterium]|nr:bifunctional riboflavin kinase/FAD synthetase [Peptococcaceae bacterium]
MYVYEHWRGVKDKHKNIVVGLGNFDGLHIGHQRLIGALVDMARELDGTPAVFTFHPHPLAVLHPENCPPLLLSQSAKQKMMAGLGVEVLLLVPFNLEFAGIPPGDFIGSVLHDDLGVKGVVVGFNYTFGAGGRGTPEMLEEYAGRCGYRLKVVPQVKMDGRPVSSTLIRGLLLEGRVTEAARFLGYHPFVEGPVVAGERRGRTLGFPTANLELDECLLVPANGVYSTKVYVDGEVYLGVANIGVKPTFRGQKRNLEVHLLDFFQDLYGKNIKVSFTSRLRGEKRFNTVTDLIKQIEADICRARALWAEAGE